ncbi:MAG: BamA/TamA family outer membrane protein [Ignavibacteriae bacterium]|nr:BamA/TamA family outer membrane protein [Ignavibacteriota bacterium]
MILRPYKIFSFLTFVILLQTQFAQKENSDSLTYINKIEVRNNGTIDSAIYEKYFQQLEGTDFIEENIELQIRNILTYFENNGYPFTSVKIQSLVFGTDSMQNNYIDIFIIIENDVLQKISKVIIEGNTKTSEKLIINEMRINKDEIYDQEKINKIPIHLNKLRFFEPVETPKYFVDNDNKGVLQLTVKEKNTNTFDGIIGYVPSQNEKENAYLTGFVNIILRNLFGTGRATSIKWKQENSLTQELDLKYLEPWLFDYPFNINLSFFQRKQDSSYVKRIFGGALEFLATENISASLILESESTIPSVNENVQNNILNSSSFNSGLQVKVDYRDDIYSPTNGIFFGSTYKYRQKKINSNNNINLSGNVNYHNYELDFSGYYSFIDNQVVSLDVHAKEIIGDYFDISDYYQFGGTNSVRGYRENQFLGNRIMWSNLEYRFLLSQRSYLFTFFDGGYYLLKSNLNEIAIRNEKYISGYGFGISLDTALGIMKVSYAFAKGESLLNGFIHFGLVNDF